MDSQLRSDALYFLKRNALFGPLGDEILSELVRSLRHQALAKGATLLREGDPGDGLYLIKGGRLRISSRTEKGEEKTVAYLGRGDAVGELALLTGEPHAFSVIGDTACDILVLGKTDFDSVLEAHPLVGIHLSRALSKRLAVSFHPPVDKPKEPQAIVLFPGLPHEATLLSVVNLAIAVVEQTRRRVLLLDVGARSGDMARTLGLNPPISGEARLGEDDLLDASSLQKLVTIHPSGLEILSLPPKVFQGEMAGTVAPLIGLLKDQYDFTLITIPVERDALARAFLVEADKTLLMIWDQAPDIAEAARGALSENRGSLSTPVWTIRLQHPSSASPEPADFRVPWSELFHQPFRETGSPYLSLAQATPAMAALDRIARAIGKLRVGIAMGSGAAYGYALIGMLRVFEREGIPVDMVSGTSMGALLGSFYCAGNSPDRIQEIARGITKRWLWHNIFTDLTFPNSGMMSGQTLSVFLRSILGAVEFQDLPIPFAVVATDIRTGQEVVLREGRVADAVRASTSLPILFRPVPYKDHFLVDGGLVNPVPTSTIATMGADILVSVNLTAKPAVRRGLASKPRPFPLLMRSPSVMEVFFKMIYTMQYEIAQARTEIAHVVIAPDLRDFLWTEFHRSEEILKIGETAAEDAVPKIKSLLPFFADYCRVSLDHPRRTF